MGRLLPDGVSKDVFTDARQLPVVADLQVGRPRAPEQAEASGSWPATSASSTRPGETGGCSVTATAVPTSSSSPGRHIVRHMHGRRRRVSGRPGPGRLLGRPQAAPETAARPAGLDPTATPTRILPCLRRSAASRRHRTPDSAGVGDLGQDGAPGGAPPGDHRAARHER